MSFAENLIDGLDVVYKHSTSNVKSYNDIIKFLNNMAANRKEYTKNLSKTIQDFRQKKLSGQTTHYYGTVKEALESYLNALEEDLNKETQITNALQLTAKDFENQVKELEKQSKSLIAEGNKITKDIDTQKEVLKKDKDKFIKHSKEAESASVAVEKAMQDPSTKVNKMQQLTQKKESAIEKAKESDSNYRSSVQTTNERVKDHYLSQQPNLLSQFQAYEETCINTLKDVLNRLGLAYSALPDAATKFVDFVRSKFDSIDPDTDINTFATTKATNGHPPEDIPIEDSNGNVLFEGGSTSGMTSSHEPNVQMSISQPEVVEEPSSGLEKVNFNVRALYDYTADAESELTMYENETLIITEKHDSGWWFATNSQGQSGFVPENYVEII
ncbi:Variant sh3 domain containing protein [Entamoeba marina]